MKHAIKRAHHFVVGYYNVLLVLLFLLFIFRPHNTTTTYLPFWKILLVFSLIASILNAYHKKIIRIICGLLAVPTIILSWFSFEHATDIYFISNVVLTVMFMSICTLSILYDVILRARVTLETLRGVICAYFMVAFAFAYIFYLIEYIHPGTFVLTNVHVSIASRAQYLSEMLYFSFVTLLTIGYGDITAAKDLGQTAVVLEGIIGQFYIAILVARIVSVYSFIADKRLLHTIQKDFTDIKKENP